MAHGLVANAAVDGGLDRGGALQLAAAQGNACLRLCHDAGDGGVDKG
jgi:hypothetical protein